MTWGGVFSLLSVLNFNCISKSTHHHAQVWSMGSYVSACGCRTMIRSGSLVHPSCQMRRFLMSGTLSIFSSAVVDLCNAFLSTLLTRRFSRALEVPSLWLRILTSLSHYNLPLNISFSALKIKPPWTYYTRRGQLSTVPSHINTQGNAAPSMLGSLPTT